jgi:signal transduction histidine kinase
MASATAEVGTQIELARALEDVSRCGRRLEVLDRLAKRSAGAQTVVDAVAAVAAALEEARDDVPFALVYLLDDGGGSARLARAIGIETRHLAAVPVIDLADPGAFWPLRGAIDAEVEARLPSASWPEPCDAAIVMPLRSGSAERERCHGFLVAGERPRVPPDGGCRSFLRLVCAPLAAALAAAELRRKLEGTADAADAALRAKDEFLAMLGHELRNPLSPILTALHLNRMRGGQTREVAVIERQVGYLVRLVEDLLDVSRIAGGKVALRKRRFELAVVVARGLEMVSPLLDEKKQRLDLQVVFEGLLIDGDADRLSQVISNLLTNASKYSNPGTTIRVTAVAVGDRARLSVRDDGIGIPGDMLDLIFERFVQQPQPLDRSKGGLGLGLTIVRSLVQLHGGTVTASSGGVGKGSEFVVELPLANLDEALEVESASPAITQARARLFPDRNRVLVVDDNRDAADSMADYLGELGYEVTVAYDGPSALTVAETFKPHTCLLDIGLPVMDGYELARLLRRLDGLSQGLRLIAVTGYGRDGDRRLSEEAGFDAHLVKPVQIDELAKIVTN